VRFDDRNPQEEHTMSLNELCTQGAAELAAMIRDRQVKSRDVVDACLARIEEVNPTVNAVTVTLADSARAAAATVDKALAAGERLGPLAGVPFTIKENVDVKGSATTWGVKALADQIAAADAPIVARLREAGAIPLARTNLPDFAFRWDTVSGRAGRTRNPWDSTRSPGGSSGGDAAALASGMTPLGLGNDLGGSLRVPSQMCGTAALRPSRGRVAHSAVTQPWPEPMARLANAGYDVVDAEPPNIAEVAATWFAAMWADVGLMLPGLQPIAGADELTFIQACLTQEVFKPVDQAAQQASWIAIHQHAADWNQFLQQHPMVLSPVCCEPPWVVDEDVSQIARIAKAMRMVVPVNILGLPSCAVPVGSDGGLPQGVQLIGARFREDLLLDAAQAIEDRAPALTPIEPRGKREANGPS
jgi:Asp-tRNA(Asn)/Glu-tRNA(Gln) amidotransferase A subunit family amidase